MVFASRIAFLLAVMGLAGGVISPPRAVAEPPIFSLDVMAALSQGGCNQGACHGNLNGKGGFKLSLRGQDAPVDYLTLTRDQGGRRINVVHPEDSLLLLKATGRVAHQGGTRFASDSTPYRVLMEWVGAGAPDVSPGAAQVVSLEVTPTEAVLMDPLDHVALRVVAVDQAGQRRDVTALTTFESSNLVPLISSQGEVTRQSFGETTILARYLQHQVPVRVAFVPNRATVDDRLPPPATALDVPLRVRWRALRVEPASVADDATFVRRIYLDLLGVLPTAEDAREFVTDSAIDKRARLIDRLLHRPEFSEHWALKWSDILRVEEKVLDVTGVDVFHRWLVDAFAHARPIDRLVSELVTARGSTYENPPANFFRANRDAATRGETTARLFLGVRLQCAQCHNHPYDRWTQDDYFAWAAVFSRVDYQILANVRSDKLDKNEFNGEQIVEVLSKGEMKNARTGQNATPRLLGADLPPLAEDADRLEPLANWLTARDNRLFAQAQANFIWYHLLGRGVVEPIDDVRVTNPPSIPGLLEGLAQHFVAHDFDLRALSREITLSNVYGLSVGSPAGTSQAAGDEEGLFARAVPRRWSAEKLLDAQSQVLDAPAHFGGFPEGMRAGQLPGVRRGRDRDSRNADGDRFLATFGKPARLLGCECERSNETTLKQAFVLLSGNELNQRLAATDSRLDRWAKSGLSVETLVDELYWTALTRAPTAAERTAAIELLGSSPDRAIALQDLTWALLNAKEFVFRK